MQPICAIGTIAIVIYIVVSVFMFRRSMEFLGWLADEINEYGRATKGKEFDDKFITFLSVITGFMWPITVFGIGCGMGVKKYCDNSKSKMTVMINNMLQRSENKDPVGKEEWTVFLKENIDRIPRHKLLLMSTFGFNGHPFTDKELDKIISNELADRDLFGIKK